jgi:hypothetical protein
MDLYLTEPVGPFPTAAGQSFGTFTTKQDVSPSPLPVINGYKLRLGSKIWIQSHGEFSTTGTPTLSLGYYIGTAAGAITTDIAISSAITTASGAAAFPWAMEWFGTVTAVGVSGTVVGSGRLDLGTALTTFAAAVPIPITQALRTVTWDTTIPRAVGVSAAYGASSASNTIKVNGHSVSILN